MVNWMWFKGLWDGLRRSIFIDNAVCPVCGKVLFKKEGFFCSSCEQALPLVREKTCALCGRPLLREESRFCRECATRQSIDRGICLMHYTEGAKAVVAEIKFRHATALAVYMGRQMGEKALQEGLQAGCILPVPLHPERLEERGYNQSAFLAAGMAQVLGLAVDTRSLVRIRPTPHQTGLSRKARQANVRDAFAVTDHAAIQGKTILLVDDVMTTGSTLRACADTLKAAGAARVITAVLAVRQ